MSFDVPALTRDLTGIRQTVEEWLSCHMGDLEEPFLDVCDDLAVIVKSPGWDDGGETAS